MAKKWRNFEEVVARIEHLLAPQGAVVKSPDRIPDKVTGRMREVDGSIRFTVGSSPILITIECRDRSNESDDTWIEQLKTKREKIGAQQTIAVHSKGLTRSAILSAKQYGIEVRQLSDITDEVIGQWAKNTQITLFVANYITLRVNVHYDTGKTDPELAVSAKFLEEFNKNTFDAPLLFGDKTLTLRQLIADARANGVDIEEGLQVDGPALDKTLTVNLESGNYYSETNKGPCKVKAVHIFAKIQMQTVRVPISAYQYRDLSKAESGEIITVGEGRFDLGGGAHLIFQISPTDKKPGEKPTSPN